MQTCRISKPFSSGAAPSRGSLVAVRAGGQMSPGKFDSSEERRGPRGAAPGQDKPEFKHFLPLPKPSHLVYVKPTVAVVADRANRASVGLKMTAGGQKLERFVVEYFARSVK
uniref:Uncharacterized protein n=1 Tax=Chlamydomonas euryale TaxID=1486919 RepID=A0A7R9YSM7_9CHLO|mmetsp:Transcript_17533/g.52709  ORF Transcript_17533/g.52709 Transcript_17533/m.52709 type:complete len:112 (+) Transcript_17533:58-393(+)